MAAEPPIQLNGWFPCTKSSMQADERDRGHPDEFYMETSRDLNTQRRAAAQNIEQWQTSSLPFLKQSFDRLYAHQRQWKQRGRLIKTRHRSRQKALDTSVESDPLYECAEFRVPMCYDGVCTSNKTVDIFVKAVKATNKTNQENKKALWVLQGGPGASSTGVEELMGTMYLQLEQQVSVYTLDHRGTGRSAKLECRAAQAGAVGSPGGSAIRLEELPACMDDIRFQLDNQTAAFSVTSAAKDLAVIINSKLSDHDVYVYGLSYGTYLVERLVHFAPPSVKGFAVDGIVSESGDTMEKRSTFSNWDYDVGVVGDHFLATCLADDFCQSKFPNVSDLSVFVHELYNTLDAAVANGKKGSNACADALSTSNQKPSYYLRSTFGEILMSENLRTAIPAILYRAARCTKQDAHALRTFVESFTELYESRDTEIEKLLYNSDMLYYLIVFSEMWEFPTPDKATLVQWYENATMASDNYLSLPYYCVFTGSREHACQELIHLPSALPLIYERDQYWNKTGNLPENVTALLMSGGMDLQTRRMYGELEYEAMSGDRMLVSFDDAGHCTTFTTPTNSGGETCGVRILASYVRENGVLKNVDTSCMNDLKPMKFSDKTVDVQSLFGTSDQCAAVDQIFYSSMVTRTRNSSNEPRLV